MSIQKLREIAASLESQTLIDNYYKFLAFARYLVGRMEETRTQVTNATAQAERKELGPEWPRQAMERATQYSQWTDVDAPSPMAVLRLTDESTAMILNECCLYSRGRQEGCTGALPLMRLKGSLVVACTRCVVVHAIKKDDTENLMVAIKDDPIINQFMDSDDQPPE